MLGIDEAARLRRGLMAGNVGENDDGKFEALGAMNRHDTHAFGALLDHRRLAGLFALGALLEVLDKAAHRGGAAHRLVAPRHVHQTHHVGQRLIPGRPDGEAGVSASGGEQSRNRVGDGTAVAPAMESADHGEGRGDFLEWRGQVVRQPMKRIEAAEGFAKAQQGAVGEREERAVQRREDREFVVGPLDCGERVADRFDFFAHVEGAATHQHMRHVARLERADVGAGDVAAVGGEAAKEYADVARANRDAAVRRLALGHSPSAFIHQPSDECGDRVRERILDTPICNASILAIGVGHRQGDHRGLPLVSIAIRLERGVGGLGWRFGGHHGRERRIDHRLDVRRRAKADGEIFERGAAGEQAPLDLLIERDVGAAEAINGLLGIAHDEELAVARTHFEPVGFSRVVGGEQQQNFGLKRIGILEFIDEDVSKARL